MKKFFLGIAIIIGILTASLFIKDWLDDRPFKFARYKDDKQFREALNTQFPIGSDIREMMKLFEQSGAECEERLKSTLTTREFDKYEIIYWCKYKTGWFNLPPAQIYEIWFMGSKDYKLIDLYGSIYSGLVI